VLAFSDAEVIRLASEEFIPVAADDWYQRRRQDAVGKFWMAIAQQGRPRDDGGTRQGIYCFTADGQLLIYKHGGQANAGQPGVMRETLLEGLRAWRNLPEERRKPGGVPVEKLDHTDPRYTRTPPAGGVILKVYTRILDRDALGQFCKGTSTMRGGDQAARDHLWLTEAEWKNLVPDQPKQGDQFPLPGALAERIARFHLIDNTRGEPPMWQRHELRSQQLSLTVTEVTADVVRLKLEGSVLLASQADPEKAERGYDVRLLGYLTYAGAPRALTRFDVVAVGDHWGRGRFTRNARPGRSPLGHVFELVRGTAPEDRIPPQAARQLDNYLGTGR
jgi:hypothetical protein